MSGAQIADYGNGTHAIDVEESDISDDELERLVLLRFASPDFQPPLLPKVALELQKLAQASDFEPNAVVTLLAQDPLLAGKVLQRAHSAAFGSGLAGSGGLNLRDAVVRLGLRNLRDVVWEAAMQMRVFRAPAFTNQMVSLQRHASATAELASAVAAFTPFPSEYAFLCGLLHDVGIAAVLLQFSEMKRPPSLTQIGNVIHNHHASISARLVELWKLPDEVRWVVGAHHEVLSGGYAHPLTAIVTLADELARRRGDGFNLGNGGHSDATPEDKLAIALQALNLSEAKLLLVMQEAKRRARSIG